MTASLVQMDEDYEIDAKFREDECQVANAKPSCPGTEADR